MKMLLSVVIASALSPVLYRLFPDYLQWYVLVYSLIVQITIISGYLFTITPYKHIKAKSLFFSLLIFNGVDVFLFPATYLIEIAFNVELSWILALFAFLYFYLVRKYDYPSDHIDYKYVYTVRGRARGWKTFGMALASKKALADSSIIIGNDHYDYARCLDGRLRVVVVSADKIKKRIKDHPERYVVQRGTANMVGAATRANSALDRGWTLLNNCWTIFLMIAADKDPLFKRWWKRHG